MRGPRPADRRGPAGAAHAAVGDDLDEPVAQATRQEAHDPGSADADAGESHLGLSARCRVSQTKSESRSKMIFTAVAGTLTSATRSAGRGVCTWSRNFWRSLFF